MRLTREEAFLLLDRAPEFRSIALVRARQCSERLEWLTAEGEAMVAEPGDWVVEDEGCRWSVKADIFRKTYRHRSDGLWEKTGTIRAVRLDHCIRVPTLEGDATARAGDWLAGGLTGDIWPIPAERFAAKYRPA